MINGLGIRREERELRKKVEEMTEKIGRLEAQLESAERAEKDAIRVVEEERVSDKRCHKSTPRVCSLRGVPINDASKKNGASVEASSCRSCSQLRHASTCCVSLHLHTCA